MTLQADLTGMRHADSEARIAPGAPSLPRSLGAIVVRAGLRDGRSVLRDLRQEGCGKAMFPREAGPGLSAVLLNTAGGVTGGDRLSIRAEAEAGARLTLTTQAAERAYRATDHETARIDVALAAGPGARIDWLPQELILFDRSAVRRRVEVDLAEDAAFLAVEPLLFGRAAMGERLTRLRFSDQWRVRRAGRPVYADALRLAGVAAALDRPATLAGARAMASVLYAAPDAEAHLAKVRRLLPDGAGASLIRPGILLVRAVAPDGMTLRRGLIPVVEALRQAPLPKTWTI